MWQRALPEKPTAQRLQWRFSGLHIRTSLDIYGQDCATSVKLRQKTCRQLRSTQTNTHTHTHTRPSSQNGGALLLLQDLFGHFEGETQKWRCLMRSSGDGSIDGMTCSLSSKRSKVDPMVPQYGPLIRNPYINPLQTHLKNRGI